MLDFINQYPIISVLICTALFFVLFNVYFALAVKYKLVDKPNERSSHSKLTIVGAGVIFYLAFVVYEVFMLLEYGELWLPFLFAGATLLSIISFIDDRKTLPNKVRLTAHFISAALLIIELDLHLYLSLALVALIAILIVGTINAYNFMDGINGITGLYTLITLFSLFIIRPNNQLDLLYYLLGIAVIVFLFYNLRIQAKCFCGDVGSISLAYILVFFLLLIMVHKSSWEYILFLAVYGVDSVLTIVYRLSKRENIFQAHRSHIYQLLVHQKGWSHIKVSVIYAVIQLAINLGLLAFINAGTEVLIVYTVFVFVLLGLLSIRYRKQLN